MSDKQTILAVDDSSDSLALLVKILTSEGFDVRPADSGELALAALEGGLPDLILLDVRMKGMDGLEVCRRLKAAEKTRNIPVILISGFADVKEWVAGLQQGAADYISKPFQKEELLARVKTQLTISKTRTMFEQQTAELKTVNAQLQGEIVKRTVVEADLRNNLQRAERSRLALLNVLEDQKRSEEQRKKLEEELRQSQKLESIGQLSSGVAHDFNNLLGGIMGNAELLQMNMPAGSPLLRHPESIISACQKAAALTRQLLSFARKAPVEMQKLDARTVVRQVVDIMERTVDRRIEIAVDTGNDPLFILGDRNQLENAILNIAINARDAMPDGGRILLKAEKTDINQFMKSGNLIEIKDGAYVKLAISDTGTGISEEIRDRIFEPFFTTKEVGKGTGLGLASVYGCVKQHNGYITVDSIIGQGTRFDIYFPLVPETVLVEKDPETGPVIHGKGTLLVIDDEKVYHDVLTQIFCSLGYTVTCYAEGVEALSFYRDNSAKVDVVILDMNMPRMSGLQCFRHLKEINSSVRVIVATGYGNNSDLQAMKNEGVCEIVQKPFRTAELAKKISELTIS